jgi:uncharacterized protein (TIGR03086 family)
MESKELFAKALEQGWHCIRHVDVSQMKNGTPCTEWNLEALLNHMVYELMWVPDLLHGKTVAEVGDRYDGDLLRGNPLNAWQHAADAALVAVKGADLQKQVNLSRGDVSTAEYINEVACDIFIHAWDVAQSIQCTLMFDEATSRAVYDFLSPRAESYRQSGSFGPSVPVDDSASTRTKLLALSGREDPLAQ